MGDDPRTDVEEPLPPEEGPNPYLDCLIALDNFGKLWAYYSLSSGGLFGEECREAASDFSAAYHRLAKVDPDVLECLGERSGPVVEHIFSLLGGWAQSIRTFPAESFFDSWFWSEVPIMQMRGWLISKLGGSPYGKSVVSSMEREYTADRLRWREHLPSKILRTRELGRITDKLSAANTISVVGDIRRSQDLMTYSVDSDVFSRKILEFFHTVRSLADECGAMFDKFTGDGFLLHFNEFLFVGEDVSYDTSFLKFCSSMREFSAPFFSDWLRFVRKVPSDPIGLALGADMGRVEFRNEQDHLIAVGDAIVWASRMATEARAGELVVNNLLGVTLGSFPGLELTKRPGVTKGGEEFEATLVEFYAEPD